MASGLLNVEAIAEDRLPLGSIDQKWWIATIVTIAGSWTFIKHRTRNLFGTNPTSYHLTIERDGASHSFTFERWGLLQGFYADMGGYEFSLPNDGPAQEEELRHPSISFDTKAIVRIAQGGYIDILDKPSAEIG